MMELEYIDNTPGKRKRRAPKCGQIETLLAFVASNKPFAKVVFEDVKSARDFVPNLIGAAKRRHIDYVDVFRRKETVYFVNKKLAEGYNNEP